MDTTQPAPMVNAELLQQHKGRKVRCVLKVVRAEAGTITGEAADGQQVTARQVPTMAQGFQTYVEVIGIVESDSTLRAEMCTNFGDNFNMVVTRGLEMDIVMVAPGKKKEETLMTEKKNSQFREGEEHIYVALFMVKSASESSHHHKPEL